MLQETPGRRGGSGSTPHPVQPGEDPATSPRGSAPVTVVPWAGEGPHSGIVCGGLGPVPVPGLSPPASTCHPRGAQRQPQPAPRPCPHPVPGRDGRSRRGATTGSQLAGSWPLRRGSPCFQEWLGSSSDSPPGSAAISMSRGSQSQGHPSPQTITGLIVSIPGRCGGWGAVLGLRPHHGAKPSSGLCLGAGVLEQGLLPQAQPGAPGAGGGVVIVAVPGGGGQCWVTPCHPHVPTSCPSVSVPVEDGGAVGADRGVAVEGEEHVALPAQLTDEALGLASLREQAGGDNGDPASPPLAPWGFPHGSALQHGLTSQSSLMCLAKSVWISVREQPRRPASMSIRSCSEYISSFSTKCCRSCSCGQTGHCDRHRRVTATAV